jgi:hypothetical protein
MAVHLRDIGVVEQNAEAVPCTTHTSEGDDAGQNDGLVFSREPISITVTPNTYIRMNPGAQCLGDEGQVNHQGLGKSENKKPGIRIQSYYNSEHRKPKKQNICRRMN